MTRRSVETCSELPTICHRKELYVMLAGCILLLTHIYLLGSVTSKFVTFAKMSKLIKFNLLYAYVSKQIGEGII